MSQAVADLERIVAGARPAPTRASHAAAPEPCRICDRPTRPFASGVVIGRHDARYDRCDACGFLQVRDPTWLEEAYGEAIADIDIGTIDRMVDCASITSALLVTLFRSSTGPFLDYGAGYGAFVRRMRDLGHDFRWYDKHADNLFAKRFVGTLDERYQLVTAFEVAEHLLRPREELGALMQRTSALLFTTQLLPETPPPLDAWPYYATETGQHIGFFTERSLHVLAERLGVYCATDGRALHLLSTTRVDPARFRLVTRPRVRRLINLVLHRGSLLFADYESGRRAAADGRR